MVGQERKFRKFVLYKYNSCELNKYLLCVLPFWLPSKNSFAGHKIMIYGQFFKNAVILKISDFCVCAISSTI